MASRTRPPRRSRRAASSSNSNNNSNSNDETAQEPSDDINVASVNDAHTTRRSVAAHVRERQRQVAEREASRLARPEARPTRSLLGHANRKKAAVASTPFGTFINSKQHQNLQQGEQEVEEWCGPFSVARQMIAQREEARRKREEEQAQQQEQHHPLDDAMAEVNLERKRKAHPSLTWKSSNPTAKEDGRASSSTSLYAKRKRRVELSRSAGEKVPTLFQLCVNFVVSNFDQVESLGDVGSTIRNAIAKELVAQQKLDGPALDALLSEDGIETLELLDASNISQEQMSRALQRLIPAGLRYVSLQHAGRCFGHQTVQAILAGSSSSSSSQSAAATTTTASKTSSTPTTTTMNVDDTISGLFALSIGGAYLLKDADAAALIRAMAPTLSSLEFIACPFLGPLVCQSLTDSYINNNRNNSLVELSMEFLPLSTEHLSTLTSQPIMWRNLKTLSLKRMEGLNDQLVDTWLKAAGTTLEHLDLSYNNIQLTDDILSSIRKYNPNLRSLLLCGLTSLTSAGLGALFTMDIVGLPPPPMLRTLKLASCHHEAVTDDVLELAALASSRKLGSGSTHHNVDTGEDEQYVSKKAATATTNTASVVVASSNLGGLIDLDVGGSRKITDTAMEVLASTSSNSLKTLAVSFCPYVTDQGLGYLVSKAHALKRMEIWGCCQITDDFLDGHARVGGDAGSTSLEIVGAWMKKSGTSSLRL